MASFVQNEFARRFFQPREQTAEHHRVRARHNRFHNIAAVFDTAVRNNRRAALVRRPRTFPNRGHLRHPRARNDARRTNRTRANAHFQNVRARVEQKIHAFFRHHISRNHLHAAPILLDAFDGIDDARRMSVRGVNNKDIHPFVNQQLDARLQIGTDAHCRAREQTSACIRRRVRIIAFLLNILDGDKSLQHPPLIHERQFFDAIFLQNRFRLFERRADMTRNQFFMRHEITDGTRQIGRLDKTRITIRQNSNQFISRFGDWHAANAIARHHFFRFVQRRIRR